MKKLLIPFLIISSLIFSFNMDAKSSKKVLVIYYSWSGNTRTMAQIIHNLVGGDIAEIIPEKAYPTDYRKCVNQASKEIKAKFKPEIKPININIADYDVIFVGTPNWWSTMAPPVSTFLSSNNFTDKTVIPFQTNGGGGMAECAIDMKTLCKGATVLNEKAIYGDSVTSSKEEIAKWLNGITVLK